ncbi:hydroxymethylbilane synthase [Pseudolysinimonas sp.]|uniref:hydroxymethylbilane synthase n=1 Tax=Pseudolysinimonas sp. TaxID=2680009 RepID=UPI003F7EB244
MSPSSSDRPLRIGTRGSALALAQAGPVAERLGAELVVIESGGDRDRSTPLAALGGSGVFVTALREALAAGEVDALIHSYKDLPTAPADGLTIAAVPARGDARDVVAARDGLTLAELPEGARVGTGSPRRRAQLLARRGDLDVVDIRGNVDTRLGRVGGEDAGIESDRRLDAVVLAAAGVERLGRGDVVTETLSLAGWPTAPAQGALAIEARTAETPSALRRVEHQPSRLAAEAERAVLRRLEAGCAAPLGVHALLEDGLLFVSARVYALDGGSSLTSSHAMYAADVRDPSEELAARVADELLELGAAELAPLGAAGESA